MVRPYSASAKPIVCTGYSAAFGSVTRFMIRPSSSPPPTPRTPPTASCSAKVPMPSPMALQPPRPLVVAPSKATMRAMPTGSFAPDSPSSRVPERPEISRRPSTEKTTAGSVGASAAPISRAIVQSKPKIQCAITARAAVVTTVPMTPSQTTPTTAERIRFQPMCMPPSNRMSASATVTMRWSLTIDSPDSVGDELGRHGRDDEEQRRVPAPAPARRAGWNRWR